MTRKHPGGLDAADFMRKHWQQEPLLVRGAFPRFADPLSPREVLALAAAPEATSRLVRRQKQTLRRATSQGPRLRFLRKD